MGKKHTRKGKCFLFHFTGCIIIIVFFSGCSNFLNKGKVYFPVQWTGERELTIAKSVMEAGNYEAALKRYRKILVNYYHELGGRVLYQIGLIYAHPKYKNVNYYRAIKYFQRVRSEFPDSSFCLGAKVWILHLRKTVQHEKRIRYLTRRSRNMKSEVKRLKIKIKRLKEIDLGIEKRKQKLRGD
jgi:hypothetical protein